MRWFREHTKLTVFFSVILMMIIIMSVSYVRSFDNAPPEGFVQGVFSVIQEPVVKAGNGLGDAFAGIFRFRQITRENEQLKGQVASLNKEVIGLKMSQNQLNEFRNLSKVLNYQQVTQNYNYVTGDVIAYDGTNWFNTFTLNIGTKEGIKKDAIVLNGDGLIGRVFETGGSWSKVITIVDESNSVSFKVLRNNQYIGIVSGNGKGKLGGYLLDPSADVIIGDVLVTSGFGVYPEGIVIGKVSEVTRDTNKLLKTVTVEPGVYFRNIKNAMVIIPK